MSDKNLFNPCIEHCFIRYGKQYTKDCDEKCDYAKMAKELRELKQEYRELDKSKVYIFTVDVTELNKETARKYLSDINTKLRELGLNNFLIFQSRNGHTITVEGVELEDFPEELQEFTELPITVYIPENTVEVVITAKVYANGQIYDVSQTLSNKEVQALFMENEK